MSQQRVGYPRRQGSGDSADTDLEERGSNLLPGWTLGAWLVVEEGRKGEEGS
eukprot:CAMPEP_0167804420 /NCGR_PEP_ID=MMETSP0111_2-20121227/20471_1 /TAXON_ID=91324 /ORGANISM="Lotharella globosa, Strain CCCM811" /LENGTH=51 /DNA_ID=CAMNT_0007701177 /DNA_START=84 /DNA_END=239 /DNA_ORIENTATION=+